jgi:chemotaxis protein MotB
MSAARRGGRRRRGGGGGEQHADERWLLTYSDMITLLMALFIVMWSISAVNKTKFEELKVSLHSAFGGKVFGHEKAILSGENSVLKPNGARVQAANELRALGLTGTPADADVENLQRIRAVVESYAKRNGFADRIQTTIDERGLVVRLLTDQLLFAPGDDVLDGHALPLIDEIARLLKSPSMANRIRVEGNTDSTPISTYRFHSNWELSAARAASVLERLRTDGVPASRLSLAGYADQHPIATNATAAGRSKNRRVELVVLRRKGVSS